MSPIGNALRRSLLIGAIAGTGAAFAAPPQPAVDVHQRYLEERAQCMKITAQEARRTCLREAGAAQVEARRGTLAEPREDYERNRLTRCSYYKDPQERSYCERRMRGEGSVSGSVEEGAIVRELVVTVPASE
jgi:hypothetical protein